jgi:hypothetical protein
MRLVGTAVLTVAAFALCLAMPAAAFALAASVPASPSVVVTATPLGEWALDFTLPTFGKSGCLVCHGDPNLVVPSTGGDVSFWIDEKGYDASAHGRVICTGCHLDFGYKAPHAKGAWRAVAKQSCSNCHGTQNQDFLAGLHAVRPGIDKSPDPKAASKPLCGDCHGAHDMAVLKDNPAGRVALRTTSEKMCGQDGCHKDFWDNYNDYYHGAAYKAGAFDAPTCWDCHGSHTVLATKDPLSPTNERNIAATCGKGAAGTLDGTKGTPTCHEGSGDAMIGYAKLIHKKSEVQAANPLLKILATVKSWFSR